MVKKYLVRLGDSERSILEDVVKRLSGSSQKVKRANILLIFMADANGPAWTDKQIAEADFTRPRMSGLGRGSEIGSF